ncbi:hypothetical protein GOBAR_AA14830 [Gossypium barbadense]|uniref:Uncharacterized protein n=1 Tax=Gossypium barbadense TaxID=3634 RepID=A0A2P5XR30_GOSBA|nr:hypothetical protein GOBAR_AA14830 [Gossypium barbadense]
MDFMLTHTILQIINPTCIHSLDTMSNPCSMKTAIPASKKRKGTASLSAHEQIQLPDAIRALLTTYPYGLFLEIIELTYLELTLEICSNFHLQVIMTQLDDPGMVKFHLGGLVRQLSVPEFRIALRLYTEEFMDDNELGTLYCHIHYSPSKCWSALVPDSATYDPSRSKALALAPSLRPPQHGGTSIFPHPHWSDVPTGYKELQSSPSLRNLKLHWKRFSTTAMSCHHDNLFARHCGYGTQPLPPSEYPPPILSLPWPIILHTSNSRIPFNIQEG